MLVERRILLAVWIGLLIWTAFRAAIKGDIALLAGVGIITIVGATILALVRLVAR